MATIAVLEVAPKPAKPPWGEAVARAPWAGARQAAQTPPALDVVARAAVVLAFRRLVPVGPSVAVWTVAVEIP